MKYLVSVENTSYFYWQLELLIESFLMHGLQDDLIICFAENESPKIGGYSKNLIKYGKKIIHENIGREKNFLPANRFYAIRNMVSTGGLEPPFTIIHSDMILKNPIDKYNQEYDVIINNYGVNKNSETIDYIEQTGLKQKLLEREGIEEDYINSFPFSMPMIFNESINKEFLNNFFEKLIINLEELIKTKPSSFPIEKTCWTYTFLESLGFYTASGAFLTTELIHEEDLDAPFIHYKRGIPPIFNKKSFKFEDATRYQTGPYECFLENSNTPNSNYVCNVIKSYLRK